MYFHKMALVLYLAMILFCTPIQGRGFKTDSLIPRSSAGYTNFSSKGTKYSEINPTVSKINLKMHPKDLDRSLKFVSENINRMRRLETSLSWSDILVKPGTPLHGQTLASNAEDKAVERGRQALVSSKATVHLMHQFCRRKYSKGQCAKYMSNVKLTGTILHDSCLDMSRACTKRDIYSKYRSMDGSCNHPYDRSKGESFTSYKRLLFPDYLDGVQEPRRSVHRKHSLPSARTISSTIIKHAKNLYDNYTMMIAQWTQFVEHDLAHTVSYKMIHSGQNIKCCSTNGRRLSPRYMHPFCAPIEIAKNDKFYGQHGLKCMSYVRSVPAIRSSCTLGPLEQLNQATHFLDASHVYGSDEKRANELRLFKGGLLKTSTNHGRIFLPKENQDDSVLLTYYLSGDPRVNTLPDLTAMHTIWLREHNRIANLLHNMNPNWGDEILYQEARRIVIAEIQHITYNEWLPTILGEMYTSRMDFPTDAITNLYAVEDPSVSNSFATAAIRFGKSLRSNNLPLFTDDREITSIVRLQDYFNNSEIIETVGNMDSFIRGLTMQSSQKLDLNFPSDITSQLYGNGKYGYDIVSLDIQRGRDHGLPSYTAFRSLCGLPEVNKFDDFVPHIPADVVKTLSKVYRHPNDVDLLIGGLAESPDGDSLLGPTFSCIIADQFLRTKYGDRYFYQHSEQPKPFTEKQLNELEQVTLARILCDNGDSIRKMQPNVFRKISSSNPLVECNSERIPHINLNYWMES